MRSIVPLRTFALAAMLTSMLSSCTGPAVESPPAEASSTDSTDSRFRILQGEVFSVPSPVLTASVMKEAGVVFHAELLSDPTSADKMTMERKKSMNLGVYGADLAYLSNYGDIGLSQRYFEAIASVASDLDILEKLDPELIGRMKENIGNRDSLLVLNATFYKEGDRYLKKSERYEVAAMILFGGWIETLHLIASSAQEIPAMRAKVGEQKAVVSSMLNLTRHFSDEEAMAMTTKLEALVSIYARMETSYQYVESIDDAANKITYLNSKTSVQVSDDQLAEVLASVEEIRNMIIQ